MYDFPPYRPPSEANSALIRVTRGCPWNHCTFCGMYKNMDYEIRPLEDIAADVDVMGEMFPFSRTVFIGDSDSLQHQDILQAVDMIRKKFPDLDRITSYARSMTLVKKDPDELKALNRAGLTRLHVGLESGDPDILKKIRKGATPEIMIKGGNKAKKAGFELCYYVLCGSGGEPGWKRHADGTARVVNAVGPDFVRLRTLSLVKNAPMYREWKAGTFHPVTPFSRLKETRRLINKLEVTGCELASDHVTNYLWSPQGIVYQGVDGMLPDDRDFMLETVDSAIEELANRDDIMDANMMVQKGYIQGL
jgi:biotin synthase-like enzyme